MKKTGLNKKPYLLRIITVAVACILLPVIMVAIQWSGNSTQLLREQQMINAEAKLTQIQSVLSLVRDNIELNYEMIGLSDQFEKYVLMSDGAALEQESPPYEDIARTAYYVDIKKEVRTLLRNAATSLDIINAVYYYDTEKNVVISYRWLDSTIERFFDLMWLQSTNSAGKSMTVLPVRTIYPTEEESYHVLSMVYRPIFKHNSPVYLVFNLDAQILYEKYLLDEALTEGDVLLFLDEEDQVMFAARGKQLMDLSVADEEYAKYITSVERAADSVVYMDDLLVSHAAESGLGWRVLLLQPTDELEYRIADVNMLILLALFLMTVFLIVTSVFLIRQTSYPASVVLHRNSPHDLPRTPLLMRSEEMDSLKQWMKESYDAQRYHFWHWAVLGRASTINTGYEPKVSSKFLLAIVDIFNLNDMSRNSVESDRRLMYEKLQEVFEERCEIVLMDGNTLLVALQCEQDAFNKASGELADCHRRIVQRMESASLLAIGGWCATVQDVQECWVRASIMLRYQRMSGSTQVRYDHQVERYASGLGMRMWELSNQMVMNMRNRAWEETLVNLENLRQELKANMKQMDYLHIRHRLQYTFTTTLEIFFKNCPQYDESMLPQDVYARTLDTDNVDMVMDSCAQLVEIMARSESETFENAENNAHVQRMLEMLQEDCGSSMNLSCVAETFGLSPVYLGKVFKRVTGTNYVQYLTDVRMEKAKKMLLEDGVRIQQVAESLGYSQSHYFAKVFKQYTNMSPSEWIRLNKKG